MRKISYLLLGLLFYTVCSLAQTELWRIPGLFSTAIQGDNGNIYLAYSGDDGIVQFRTPDTLTKVAPTGQIIWQKELPSLKKALFGGSGVYVILYNSSFCDTAVWYIDTAGILQWNYTLPDTEPPCGYPYSNMYGVDNSGNLFALIQYSTPTLIKLDKSGTRRFQVTIPSITLSDDEDITYKGPFIDQTGVVWVVAHIYTPYEKETERSYMYADYYSLYAFRFNGETGSLLSHKYILKKDVEKLEKGDYSEPERHYTLIEVLSDWKFTAVGGNLVGWDSHSYSSTEIIREVTEKRKSLSQWRIITIDANLRSKLFKYKGKGADICRDVNWVEKSDFDLNYINDIAPASSNSLYATGSIARGKSKCGVPGLKYDGVLMKFGLDRKKSIWVKKFPDQSVGFFYVSRTNKILALKDEHTISIYDQNGNYGTTLTFTDRIDWNYYYGGFIKQVNNEDGFIYLRMREQSTDEHFFAKYSIPSLQFSPSHFATLEEIPEEFTLYQNYPNPFNPVTTIQFVLSEKSYVTLKVYNTLGQEVATLLNQEELEDGVHELEFEARHLSSGVYYYRLVANPNNTEKDEFTNKTFVNVKKMILSK